MFGGKLKGFRRFIGQSNRSASSRNTAAQIEAAVRRSNMEPLESRVLYSGANLVSDGGFEAPTVPGPYTAYSAGQSIGPWVVDSGGVAQVGSYWQPASGAVSVELNGPPSGGISQTLATTPGQNSQTRSEPPLNRAASLLSTTHVRQVSGRSRIRGASTTRSLSLFLSVSLARTRASGSAARPSHRRGRFTSARESRASMVPQLHRAAASAQGRHSSRHG